MSRLVTWVVLLVTAPGVFAAPGRAVWCERLFYDSRNAALEERAFEGLAELASRRVDLHQAIDLERLRAEPPLAARMVRFLRRAEALKVPTRLWIILPVERGYWSNDENARESLELCRQTMAWVRENRLGCRWLVVDMEPSLAFNDAASELVRQGRYVELAVLLARNLDPASFSRARETYVRLVEEAHRGGFRVLCVTYPHVLDGLKLRTTFVEDLLNIPVSGIPWDAVSFMVYRTVFAEYVGEDLGAALVEGYARDALRFFGAGAALDVGVVGDRFYGHPDRLAEDVRAIEAAGMGRHHVFCLEGMLARGGVRAWLEPARAPAGDAARWSSWRLWLYRWLLERAEEALGGRP